MHRNANSPSKTRQNPRASGLTAGKPAARNSPFPVSKRLTCVELGFGRSRACTDGVLARNIRGGRPGGSATTSSPAEHAGAPAPRCGHSPGADRHRRDPRPRGSGGHGVTDPARQRQPAADVAADFNNTARRGDLDADQDRTRQWRPPDDHVVWPEREHGVASADGDNRRTGDIRIHRPRAGHLPALRERRPVLGCVPLELVRRETCGIADVTGHGDADRARRWAEVRQGHDHAAPWRRHHGPCD